MICEETISHINVQDTIIGTLHIKYRRTTVSQKNINKVPTPKIRYGVNGTIVVLRVKEGTPKELKEKGIEDAKRMAVNESTTYTSSGKRKYRKKNQISLFGGIL